MNLILEEISKRNRKVFKIFFNKHYKNFVIYADGYLFDKPASEDVVQEVYIYIWEKTKEKYPNTTQYMFKY